MSTTVCLLANTLYYPEGGGHLWVYLNWALGLRALGCRVIWMEAVVPSTPTYEAYVGTLKSRLERYGLAESVALCSETGEPLSPGAKEGCIDLEEAAEADLLLNFAYSVSPKVVQRFRRSALIDIDPGLLQVWISKGWIHIAQYDVYFSTGETVGQPEARFPDAGLKWEYVPPCVAVDWWPPRKAARDAVFTTVSHWSLGEDEWIEDDGQFYNNEKRAGFLPFLSLPQCTTEPLELALCLGDDEQDELQALQQWGWRVRHSHAVASTPWDYQRYIQESLGEFSCVKPSCVRLQNAWISDRTICYLASGKPAVVQHTGPSRFLPDCAGLFRFRDVEEAVRGLETVVADYERQSRLARTLAEEHFDAKKVAGRVLEQALA